VAIAIDTLRIATDGVRIAANSTLPQQVTLFSDLLSLTTSRIAATYANNAFSLTIDGALSLLGRSDLAMQGLVLRSDGTVSGGAVEFGQSIPLLAGRLSLASLAFASDAGRLGVDLGGSLTLPAPFGRSAPFSVRVRPGANGWSAEMQAPSIAFGTQLAINDNVETEIRFGSVATFDLLNLGIALDLRAPRSSRITASAALYLMNDVGRAIVFGSPSNAATEPGLLIDGSGVRWNATLPGNLPTLDLGLFRYALTGFGGVSAGAGFGLEFSGQASLDVPGVEGTMALEGLSIGLDGASPGRLGNGPHELSLMSGLATFRIGAMERGADTALTLTEAGAGARATTTTVQAEEFIRLTNASMSLGMGFLEGGVREVLIYRLADGTRSVGVTDAALSLVGITTLNASMRYVNGPEGYRLSAGGSAVIVGGTGFGAAGFFSNRGGTLGAGIFVAANANIPLLPPLISLSGIGGGLFINPTGEDVQMVLSAVEGLGVRLVGDPPPLPRGEERMGFAAFLYGGVGLIGAAGGYAIDGKGLLQLTSAYLRLDARGVLLGQTDRLDAGVSFEVSYGNGVRVAGSGEVTVEYPGVTGRATVDFFAGTEGGNFDWAFSAQARLRVVAFTARGVLFVSRDGFYAEVGIGSGFSYGPVDIGAEVVVGTFIDAARGKVGAFGIVSAYVDIGVASADATLKGALVISRSSAYLGFGGVAHARVADYEVSGAVHASFDNGDFSAGLGHDRKLDRVIEDMRSTANRIERSASDAASQLRASAEANWWRADEQTLSNAGFALITLPADQRARILEPVLAAERRTVLPAAQDYAPLARSRSPGELRQWVLDSVYADRGRPLAADADAERVAFEGLAAGTGTVAASVLDRVRLRIEGGPSGAAAEMPAGSPISVTASATQPMRMTLDVAAYDALGTRVSTAGASGGTLEAATAILSQAEAALDTLDRVFGYGPGGGASLANVGELFALSRDRLERYQSKRIAIGLRAREWASRRRAALMIFSSGTEGRYRLGWGVTLPSRGGYLALAEAAVARRQALLDLAAFSAPLGAQQPVSNAQAFRSQLLALDTISGRDADFLNAVAGTWGELWVGAPNRGLATMEDSANGSAAPLLPVFAVQRDSLARRHEAVTTVVDGLYGGRFELTAQLAALYDEARQLPGAPAEWTARRDALMVDLEPPSLGDIRVQSRTADAVITSEVTWTATHPGGLAGFDADASRDGGAMARYVGGAGLVTVATAREAPTGDYYRRYNVSIKARSRAGAAVRRTAVFDVEVPSSGRGGAGRHQRGRQSARAAHRQLSVHAHRAHWRGGRRRRDWNRQRQPESHDRRRSGRHTTNVRGQRADPRRGRRCRCGRRGNHAAPRS
jgi:hypothetical protein